MAGQTLTIVLTHLVIYFWCQISALNAVVKIRPVCGVVHIQTTMMSKYEHPA